jgi:RHS repeat-associated protein
MNIRHVNPGRRIRAARWNARLDDKGRASYYLFGATSYQGARSVLEAKLKRYRYTRMERDEETGFAYHGACYCAPWLGRWTAPDRRGR